METIHLFVDDIRNGGADRWTIARTRDAAVEMLEAGNVVELSLDYDLDETDDWYNGGEVVDWMVEHGVFPPVIHLHTANDYGRRYMWDELHKHAPEGTVIDLTYEAFPKWVYEPNSYYRVRSPKRLIHDCIGPDALKVDSAIARAFHQHQVHESYNHVNQLLEDKTQLKQYIEDLRTRQAYDYEVNWDDSYIPVDDSQLTIEEGEDESGATRDGGRVQVSSVRYLLSDIRAGLRRLRVRVRRVWHEVLAFGVDIR